MTVPEPEEVRAYFIQIGVSVYEAEKFYDHFESNGWRVGGKASMKNWQAAARNWKRRGLEIGTIKLERKSEVWKCPDCGARGSQYSHDCPKNPPADPERLKAILEPLLTRTIEKNEEFRCPKCQKVHSPKFICESQANV